MNVPLRIVFLGSDPIALPLLDWLAREGRVLAEVIAVFTQPDRPVGRGQKIVPNEIKQWATTRGIPVHQPEKLTEDVRLQLVELKPDLSLVMAYGHILRDDFIDTPKKGTVNLHASLLPRYRGASPIQTAIANGETETGVSFMRIVRRLDAGPVADLERVAIDRLDTALSIEAKLAAACVPLVARAFRRMQSGSLEFLPQDDSTATFCRRLTKEDGVLDFQADAHLLAARINGLFPWPACSVEINGHVIKFGLADTVEANDSIDNGSTGAPGSVVGSDQEGLLIAAGGGTLRVRRMQRPGGKMLDAKDFLRGFPLPKATVIPSHTMPVLVATAPFKK
jgi:methionyl-tRNA formyltransferase